MMISLADEANDPGWMRAAGRRGASDMERTARFLWKRGGGGVRPFTNKPNALVGKVFLGSDEDYGCKNSPGQKHRGPPTLRRKCTPPPPLANAGTASLSTICPFAAAP